MDYSCGDINTSTPVFLGQVTQKVWGAIATISTDKKMLTCHSLAKVVTQCLYELTYARLWK